MLASVSIVFSPQKPGRVCSSGTIVGCAGHRADFDQMPVVLYTANMCIVSHIMDDPEHMESFHWGRVSTAINCGQNCHSWRGSEFNSWPKR